LLLPGWSFGGKRSGGVGGVVHFSPSRKHGMPVFMGFAASPSVSGLHGWLEARTGMAGLLDRV